MSKKSLQEINKEKLSNISVSAVIPVYNSEKTIIDEITQCKKILKKFCGSFEIIVADDKSTDLTRELLKKNFNNDPHIRLIFNTKNKGIAKNILQLYRLAQYDYILFYVADGDWRTESIEDLLKKLISSNADIIIGKRIKKGGYTLYRHIISYLHNILPRILFGVDTVDAGSLKIYRKALVKDRPILSRSIFLDAEIIIRARKGGATLVVCPVAYQKPQKSSGVAASFPVVIAAIRDVFILLLKRPDPSSPT